MNKKLNGLMHKLSAITISMAFFLMLYFGYLLWYPFKTIEFYKDSFQTVKTQYFQSEALTYKCHYNKYISLQSTVTPMLVDSIVYQLPTMQVDNPMGEQDFIKSSINIPRYLPPGIYALEMTITYKINPFREISHKVKTNEFEVIAYDNLKEDIKELQTYSYGYQDHIQGKRQ